MNNGSSREGVTTERPSQFESKGAADMEQWAVNKAVHYNEWANLGKKDFEPVVAAYKDFLERFRCAACESWRKHN